MPCYSGDKKISKIYHGDTLLKKGFKQEDLVYSLGAGFKSFTTRVGASGMIVVMNKPESLAIGDHMYCIIACDAAETITPPAGWTQHFVPSATTARDTSNTFYKVADAADVAASDYNFTISTSEAHCAALLCFDGAAAVPGGADYESAPVTGGVYTDTLSLACSDGSYAIAYFTHENPDNPITSGPDATEGFTELLDIYSQLGNASPFSQQRLMVYIKQITAAETVNATFTVPELYRRQYGLIEIEGA